MSANRPWLSIIVPAYNAEQYLEDCINSVNPAGHEDVELILVDDGSDDSTPDICDYYAGKYANVKAIHRNNGGSPSARNTGFAHAMGYFVWFVDSDDLIAPGALDVMRSAVARSDADALQIDLVPFSYNAAPSWPSLVPFGALEHYSAESFLSGIYNERFQHFMCSFLIRLEALREGERASGCDGENHNGFPFREDFSLYDDVVAMEELVRRFRCIDVLKIPVYGYRQVPTSITRRRNNASAESGLRAVREISKYEVPSEDAPAKACMEVSLLFTAYKLAGDEEGESLRASIKREIDARVKGVGLLRLGTPRLARYFLLKTGLLDVIIRLRGV